MELTIHPLTPDLWPALEDLFSAGGPVSRCWCMYWRIGDEYRERPCEVNKEAFCELVQSGPHPGVLAFDGERVTGIAPLEEYTASSPQPLFRDVTGAMFQGVSSFSEQLARGIPYWVSRLDAASGIDLFGRNGIAVGASDKAGVGEI